MFLKLIRVKCPRLNLKKIWSWTLFFFYFLKQLVLPTLSTKVDVEAGKVVPK
jgi:hypothetical protein